MRPVLMLLAFAATATAADPDVLAKLKEQGAKAVQKAKAEIDRQAEDARSRLAAVKRAKLDPKAGSPMFTKRGDNYTFTCRDKEKRDQMVETLNKKLADLEAEAKTLDQRGWTVPNLYVQLGLNVGQVGFLKVSEKQFVRMRVIQIVDKDSMLVYFANRTFWLNAPTAGLVDDDHIQVTKAVHVKGTRSYETTTGAKKTVLELDAFDPPE